MTFHLYKRGRAIGVFAQNIPFFSPVLPSDIRTGLFNAIWNISIIPTTTSKIQFTLDNGVTWFDLTPTPLIANEETVVNITCDGDDEFNLRCPDVAGVTLYRAVVSIAPVDFQQKPLGSGTALKVDICPVNCNVPVDIQNQPIQVSGSVSLTSLDLILASITNVAKAINVKWFTTDIPPVGLIAGQGIESAIHFAINTRAKIQYSLDGAVTWVGLNNGFSIEPDVGNVYTIPMIFGDTLNFRADKALTVIFARVVQS